MCAGLAAAARIDQGEKRRSPTRNTPQPRAFRGTDAKESPILLLSLGKLHLEAKTAQARASLERQITAANDEVDRFVFALYGLAEDDGKVVDVSIGEIGDDQD